MIENLLAKYIVRQFTFTIITPGIPAPLGKYYTGILGACSGESYF